MKIEDEIKQKKFVNEHEKLVVNILFTSNWLMSKQNEVMKPYSVSVQQYNILRILKGQYPKSASVNLLIERMMDKNSNASRLVDKLITKKLVVRKECTADRRKVDVMITKDGIELVDKITLKLKKMNSFLEGKDEKEAVKMNDYLDNLRTLENK